MIHFARVSSTEARSKFHELDQWLEDESAIIITKHGQDSFAIVNIDYLETLLDAAAMLADPKEAKRLFDAAENTYWSVCERVTRVRQLIDDIG